MIYEVWWHFSDDFAANFLPSFRAKELWKSFIICHRYERLFVSLFLVVTLISCLLQRVCSVRLSLTRLIQLSRS